MLFSDIHILLQLKFKFKFKFHHINFIKIHFFILNQLIVLNQLPVHSTVAYLTATYATFQSKLKHKKIHSENFFNIPSQKSFSYISGNGTF